MPDARPSAPAGAVHRDRVVARSAQWPAGWLVFSYLLGAAFVVLSATGPGPDDAARLDTPGLRIVLVAVDLIAAALALALALRIRRRPSRWPIALLLIWLLLEGIGKLAEGQYGSLALHVFLLMVAGRALAAAQSVTAGGRSEARAVDPTVF